MLNSVLLVSLLTAGPADTTKLSQHHLSEVVVTDRLPLSSLNLDIRRVGLDVAQPAAMMSVNDLLSMTPSVDTDIEGNVYVRNSDKVQFTLNTVPLGYLNENRGDILLQMPSSMMGEVRVIQNPSVRYIPDGVAGIVDFRTRNNTFFVRNKKATSQIVGLEAGSHGRVGADYLLQTNVSDKFRLKFGIQTKQDYRSREFKNRTLFLKTQEREEQNNDASAYPWTNSALFSAAYKVRPYLTMQLTADGMLSDYDRTGNIRNDKYKAGETEPATKARVTRYNDQKFATGGLQYKAIFDLPEDLRHSFQFEAAYRYYDKKERNHFDRRPKPDMLVQDSSAFSSYSNDLYATINHRFYEHTDTRNGNQFAFTLNSGANYRREDGVLISSKDYIKPVKPAVRDHFRLIRSVYSLYTEAVMRVASFTLEAGVRGEYTHLYQSNMHPQIETRKDRFEFYPRVAVTYDYRASQWRMDYSRRVNRPLLSELNPSVNNSDPTRIFTGNPDLKPELADNLSLGYRYAAAKWSLMPQLFYTRTSRAITDVYLDDNKVTKDNLDNTTNAGAELSFIVKPAGWVELCLSGFIARSEIDGRALGYSKDKSATTGGAQCMVTFRPFRTTDIQLTGNYISDRITLQGTIHERYRVNASLTQRLWNDRLYATITVNDLFNSIGERTTIRTAVFEKTIMRHRDPQVIMCGVKMVI